LRNLAAHQRSAARLAVCLQHGHRDIQQDYELRNVLGQGEWRAAGVRLWLLMQGGSWCANFGLSIWETGMHKASPANPLCT